VNREPIRVLYIPARGKAGFREIANDLASLFELVGEGQLDVIELAPNISLFCDDSRNNREFSYNFSIGPHHIHGDAFILRRSGMDVISIDDNDIARLMALRETFLEAERT